MVETRIPHATYYPPAHQEENKVRLRFALIALAVTACLSVGAATFENLAYLTDFFESER